MALLVCLASIDGSSLTTKEKDERRGNDSLDITAIERADAIA